MPYYVCKGAKLKCSMGSDQSALEVVHLEKPVHLCGQPMAGIMDHKPMMNIKPFGQCKSLANPVVAAATAANYGRLQEMPCIPNTMSPWLNGKMNVFVKGQPALVDASKCACAYAGVIEVADAGQKVISYKGRVGAASASVVPSEPVEAGAAPGGNALASQGTGASQAAAGNAASSQGIAASGSQASQGASNQKTLVREVNGAADVYSRQYIEYKVASYNKDQSEVSDADRNRVRWAVKVDGKISEFKDDNGEGIKGEKILLEIPDYYAGKEITVMACLDGFNENVSQKTQVGPLSQKTLIRVVEGAERASPGQKLEYKVTRYNKDYVSDEFRNSVKWAVKVDGKQKEVGTGERITIEINKEWSGKEITVMPYLNEATEKVSVRTMVGKVTEMYWSYGTGCNRLSDKSLYYEDLNFHVKTENYNDGDMVSIALKRDDGKSLFGTTKTLELSGKVYNNELIFKDVLKKYALDI